MNSSATSSPALPISYAALRIVIILNWVMGAAVVALLVAAPNERWIMSAFDLTPSPEATRLVWGLRICAAFGLVVVVLNYAGLKRLVAIVDTVRDGDPFVSSNAERLQTIAWVMVALQIISMIIAGIADAVALPGRPIDMDAGFSINGWLAVLLTFLLARVFAEGARMRDDLEGTV